MFFKKLVSLLLTSEPLSRPSQSGAEFSGYESEGRGSLSGLHEC